MFLNILRAVHVQFLNNERTFLELTAKSLYCCSGNGGYHPYCIFLYKEIPIVDKVLWMVFTIKQFNIRGAFGKFLAWSYISVTNLQTLSCLVSFKRAIFPLFYGTILMSIL